MAHLEGRLATSAAPAARMSKRLLAARVISAIPILFLTFDAVIKLVKIAPVVDAFAQLGYSIALAPTIGVLALVCVAVYAIPRTAIFILGNAWAAACSPSTPRAREAMRSYP